MQNIDTVFPIQPIYTDKNGVHRFVTNRIVTTLLETSKLDLNDIAAMEFTKQERMQFAQLIGYSVCGFGELRYVDEDTYKIVYNKAVLGDTETETRIKYLRATLRDIRLQLLPTVSNLYGVHPDDLMNNVEN